MPKNIYFSLHLFIIINWKLFFFFLMIKYIKYEIIWLGQMPNYIFMQYRKRNKSISLSGCALDELSLFTPMILIGIHEMWHRSRSVTLDDTHNTSWIPHGGYRECRMRTKTWKRSLFISPMCLFYSSLPFVKVYFIQYRCVMRLHVLYIYIYMCVIK